MTNPKTAFALVVALCAFASPAIASEISGGLVAIIACPAKGKLVKTIDLSTGAVPWIVEGPDLPIQGKAMATPVDENSIPQGWKARSIGANWVQALPENDLAPHAPGTYIFSIEFVVKKSKRMPRLSLRGQVTADQNFDLNLIEPTAPNQHVASGLSAGDDTPGEVEQGDMQDVNITKSGGLNTKPLGHYPGLYVLQISVENGAGIAPEVGLLAGLKLGVNCGGK